jgi:hypothetical protein
MGKPKGSTAKFNTKSVVEHFGNRVMEIYAEQLRSRNPQTRYRAARELKPHIFPMQPQAVNLEATLAIQKVTVEIVTQKTNGQAVALQHAESGGGNGT